MLDHNATRVGMELYVGIQRTYRQELMHSGSQMHIAKCSASHVRYLLTLALGSRCSVLARLSRMPQYFQSSNLTKYKKFFIIYLLSSLHFIISFTDQYISLQTLRLNSGKMWRSAGAALLGLAAGGIHRPGSWGLVRGTVSLVFVIMIWLCYD